MGCRIPSCSTPSSHSEASEHANLEIKSSCRIPTGYQDRTPRPLDHPLRHAAHGDAVEGREASTRHRDEPRAEDLGLLEDLDRRMTNTHGDLTGHALQVGADQLLELCR